MAYVTTECLESSIGELESTIQALELAIAQLTIQVQANTAAISVLQAVQHAHTLAIAELKRLVAKHEADIAAIKASDILQNQAISTINTAIRRIDAKDEEQDRRLDALEGPDAFLSCATDCNGDPIPASGATLVTCQNLSDILVSVPENLKDCDGNPLADGTAVVDCDRFNEVINTLPCGILSTQSGQLLQCRDDGIYYGVESPPDVRNQFVDAVNGNDANAGTRVSPLKTLKAAYDKIPQGTRDCTIYLQESQVHLVGYLGDSKASFYIRAYGAQNDLISAQWYSVPQGWRHYWAEASFAVAPTLRSTAELVSPTDGGSHAEVLTILTADKVVISGVKLETDYGAKSPAGNFANLGMFSVSGALEVSDCTVLNAYLGGKQWYVGVGFGGSIVTYHVKLQTTQATNPWLYPYISLSGFFGNDGYPTATLDPSGSGLMVAATTPNADLKSLVFGAVPPAPQSPNFPTNI